MNAFLSRLAALGVAGVLCLPLAAQQTPAQTSFVPSDKLNKELPKWLRFSGDYRARLEGFTGGGRRFC